MKPKKAITILALAAVLLFVSYSMSAFPLVSDEKYTYIAGMRWYKNYDEGQVAAREQNKPMLVYFWAIWCKFCEKLHTEVYPSAEISKMLREDFVLVAVDLDVNKEDARRFNVQYPPQLIFLSPESKILVRIPGYLPKEELLPIMQQLKARGEVNISTEELPQTKR